MCIIGLRFILKPETSSDKMAKKGEKLDLKGILISIFFGLTISFGTGGGMMMLVVFTLFLGMDRKTAVGTSTFIMTFTALIAFISHTLSYFTIITEDLSILILCIVTGIVLTLTGITMLIINYHDVIFNYLIF